MTISTTTNKISYTGNNSTTVFAYNFKILADADLQVYNAGVLQTITTHYTVSGAGDAGGGNVTFVTAPATDASVVIVRNMAQTQQVDYVANDPFPAETHEGALDRLTLIAQDVSKDVEGAFRFADTVTDAGTITVDKNATDRANKLLAFDSSGGLSADQEIGTFQGNWAASTAYAIRDIIKDTSNNNIYICKTAHTSSGSQPISSNADVAKWDLLVDAASASTSATAAASSASAAATSEANAAASATSSASSAASSSSSATSSASSATSSASSATSSASSSTTAGEYANKVDGAVTGTEFSSKAWALGGTGVTDTASRGAAKEWATAAEDDLVDGSEYSAKHYSLKAQAHATNAAANSGPYYSATTGTNTYVATPTPALTSYAEGVDIILKFGTGNTGATTLNVSGLGAKDLTKADGSAFSSGELTSGQIQHFVYNGTEFRLMGTVAATEELIKINTLDIFQNTINDMADHSDNLLETVDGFTDNFQDGSTQNNTAFDLTNSSGVTHDNINKLWGNTDGSTNQNSDKDYTTESNYIQQEWDENIVGANATFTNGSATVTTTGTFPTNATGGRISQDGTNWYIISSRDSATQLTLSSNFAQSTVTGTFTIRMSEFDSGVVKLSDNSSFTLGDGRDGSVTITTAKNINTDVIGSSRSTNADGIVTTVSSNPTGSSISVASITGFADGDKLLLMNLQGATGDVADVGNYEILTVSGTPTGTTINVAETISKSYDGSSFSSQKVICQRIPQWSTVTVNGGGSITCNAFDGSKGGIVICYATGAITLASGTKIHANEKGYRGGWNWQPSGYGSGAAYVGEGRTGNGGTLRQTAANDCGGGGGSNDGNGYSFGGGGGSHSTAGVHGAGGASAGDEGDTWGDATLSPRIGFGGAGGQGGKYQASDNDTYGGHGGGIVYLTCDSLTTTAGGLIQANGQDMQGTASSGRSGGSGGGAGGTVWIDTNTITAGANDITCLGGDSDGIFASQSTNYAGGDGGNGFVRIQYTTINSQSFENDTEENSVCDPDPTGSTGSSSTPGTTSVPDLEYVSVADSYAQSTDVSAWLDINSSAVTETLNSQNVYYWYSFDPASSYGAGTEIVVPKPAIAEVIGGIDSNAKLVLHFDGSDGSTTFTDSSSTGHTVTAVNQTQVDTAQSKFGGASGLFDGTDDHLTVPNHADWDFFSSASDTFTLDCWVRLTAFDSSGACLCGIGTTSSYQWNIGIKATEIFFTRYDAAVSPGYSNLTFSHGGAFTLNNWHHVALIKGWGGSAGSIAATIDGVQVGTVVTGDTYYQSTSMSGVLYVGRYPWGITSYDLNGHMDELRLSSTARWTSNFTPYSVAYTTGTLTPASSAYIRPIAKNDGGTWKYNSNSSANNTFTAATSTVNDMLHATSQAISSEAENRLTSSEISSLVDADFELTNGFSTSDSKLTRGLTLYSASSSQSPEVSQFRVNYDSDKLDGTFLTRAFGGTNMPPAPSSNISTMVALIIDKRTTGTPTYEASSNGGTTWTEFSTWIHEDLMSNGYTKRMAEIDVSAHTGARTSPLIRIKNGSSGEDYDLKAIGIKYK